eukprot:SAG22_NODE_293_length_12891_cov_17.337242_4_plen_39_part_00
MPGIELLLLLLLNVQTMVEEGGVQTEDEMFCLLNNNFI